MAHVDSEPDAIREWTDPIVAEVRANRDAIAARYDYDIDRIAAAFAERSRARGQSRSRPVTDQLQPEADAGRPEVDAPGGVRRGA